MAVTLGSNVSSLVLQRQLSRSGQKLSGHLERLSSGLRIQRASDDAAGLAISESLQADRRIINQGIRNANDGISALSIADGAINELKNLVIRIQELAEQSANGIYTSEQRLALDKEAQALADEFNRIVDTTKFNGFNLLDGSVGSLGLQVGLKGDENSQINVDLGNVAEQTVGDGTFADSVSSSTFSNLNGLTSADFNGDGNQDLVAISNSAATIRLGNGDGSFQAQQTFYVTGVGSPVGAGDFDNNGTTDLLVADISNGFIRFHSGNGDGTFAHGVSFDVGTTPQGLTVDDFNNDGNLDVASTEYISTNGEVRVFLGDGSGNFTSSAIMAAGGFPSQVSSGDLNGDGIADLIASDSQNDKVSVFIGNGDGTFAARTSYVAYNLTTGVLVGDVNGDGSLDVVSSTSDAGGSFRVFLGNGDGTLNAGVDYSTGDLDVNAGGPHTALQDFDGDGILDVVASAQSDNAVYVHFGNGDGTFQAGVSYASGGLLVNVADFNNDGAADILSGRGSSVYYFQANTQTTGGLPDFNLLTADAARSALVSMGDVRELLSSSHGRIGASQVRLEVAIQNNNTASIAFADARSRIVDADVAEEAAGLVSAQILQQAAAALLAQANQQPGLALKLLSFE